MRPAIVTMLGISVIESEFWKIFQNTRVTKKARRICIMANRQSKLVEEQIEVGEEQVRVATIEGELFLVFTLGVARIASKRSMQIVHFAYTREWSLFNGTCLVTGNDKNMLD